MMEPLLVVARDRAGQDVQRIARRISDFPGGRLRPLPRWHLAAFPPGHVVVRLVRRLQPDRAQAMSRPRLLVVAPLIGSLLIAALAIAAAALILRGGIRCVVVRSRICR